MNISLAKIIPIILGTCALTAQAALITGQINITSGSVVLTPNLLGAVTQVGPSLNGIVSSVEGSYPAALIGDSVAFKIFNVALGAQPITSLWSVTDTVAPIGTGFTYSFDLASITAILQQAASPTQGGRLNIDGLGTLRSTNPALDPTFGFWTYGINSADGSPTNGVFSFQSNNVALGNPNTNVPDGGSSMILLGVSLLGIFALSRRLTSLV